MKTQTASVLCLLPVLLCTACANLEPPTTTVSQSVIESLLPPSHPEQPWRLDSAWQQGGLGGAALRVASVEHVVRQADQKLMPAINSDASAETDAHANNAPDSIQITKIDADPLRVERAWRKYCHHQLDMIPEERALIAHTAIPHAVLKHGCNPRSLKK
jgi:hypothetical protein